MYQIAEHLFSNLVAGLLEPSLHYLIARGIVVELVSVRRSTAAVDQAHVQAVFGDIDA